MNSRILVLALVFLAQSAFAEEWIVGLHVPNAPVMADANTLAAVYGTPSTALSVKTNKTVIILPSTNIPKATESYQEMGYAYLYTTPDYAIKALDVGYRVIGRPAVLMESVLIARAPVKSLRNLEGLRIGVVQDAPATVVAQAVIRKANLPKPPVIFTHTDPLALAKAFRENKLDALVLDSATVKDWKGKVAWSFGGYPGYVLLASPKLTETDNTAMLNALNSLSAPQIFLQTLTVASNSDLDGYRDALTLTLRR